MNYYIVHHLDIGIDPSTVRAVAAGDINDIETPELFEKWLNENNCHFKAAIVNEQGEVVVADPRHFNAY